MVPTPNEASPPKGGARARLVLADDHRLLLECLQLLLEPEFDVVGTASDGPSLLRLVRELRPDLVVTDVWMPTLSGVDVMRELEGDDAAPRFLFLTMHRDPQLAAMVMQRGAAGFVLKQSATTELVGAIHSVLAKGVWLSPAIAGDVLRAREADGGAEPTLTGRQREVLELFARGLIAKEVAQRLGISRKTVEYHKYKTMQVLGVRTTAELIRYASKRGLLAD